MNELCDNCGKKQPEHVIEGPDLFCYPWPRMERWKTPEPQAALFADVHRTTGYEL